MSDFPSPSSGLSGLNAAELLPGSVPSRNSTTPSNLSHAAGEFESILLNQWLEGAEASFASVPGADDDQDAGDQQMKSFAVQALAKGITAAGGIGLAGLLSKALSSHGASAPGEGSVTPMTKR